MRLPAPFYHARHRSSALWSSVPDMPAQAVPEVGGDTLDAIWRQATGDPIYGPALRVAAQHVGEAELIRCTRCEVPLRVFTDLNGRGWWVHADAGGTFWCRGEHGMILDGQYATPPPGTPPLPSSPAPRERSSPDPAPASPGGHTPSGSPVRGRPPRPYPPVVASYPAELAEGIILGHPGAA